MAKTIKSRYPARCAECDKSIPVGSYVRWERGGIVWHTACEQQRENMRDPEYARGVNDTRQAQMMGPAGSEAREAAYMAMEQQWLREGFDG